MKVLCSERCSVCFHYPACWHAFERAYKADHPEFSFKACTLIMPEIPMQGPAQHACQCRGRLQSHVAQKKLVLNNNNKHVGGFLAGCVWAMFGRSDRL